MALHRTGHYSLGRPESEADGGLGGTGGCQGGVSGATGKAVQPVQGAGRSFAAALVRHRHSVQAHSPSLPSIVSFTNNCGIVCRLVTSIASTLLSLRHVCRFASSSISATATSAPPSSVSLTVVISAARPAHSTPAILRSCGLATQEPFSLHCSRKKGKKINDLERRLSIMSWELSRRRIVRAINSKYVFHYLVSFVSADTLSWPPGLISPFASITSSNHYRLRSATVPS
jgi:hypothetical protein